MSEFVIKSAQITIAATVMFAAIYFQQSTGYDINPGIVGAWSFMAAYGATYAVVLLLDRRVRLGRILPRFGGKKGAN